MALFALTALQPHVHWGYSRPKPAGWVFTLQPSLSTAWAWGKGVGHLTHQTMSVFLNTAQYCSIQPTISQCSPLLLNTAHYFSMQPTIAQYSPLFLNTAHYFSIQPTIAQYSPLFLNTAHYCSIQPTISQYSPVLLNTAHYFSIQPTCLRYVLSLLPTYSIVFLYLFPDCVLNTHTHESQGQVNITVLASSSVLQVEEEREERRGRRGEGGEEREERRGRGGRGMGLTHTRGKLTHCLLLRTNPHFPPFAAITCVPQQHPSPSGSQQRKC